MVNVSLGKKRLKRRATALSLFLFLLGGPASVFASTILPSQILPPAPGKTCAPVTFSDIQAHIYNNSLDSFDISVSNPSYVAIATSVGKTPIGYTYLTRWANSDGSLKVHVDLQPTNASRDIPVQMTFLAVQKDQGGNPVTCLFEVSATIPGSTMGTGVSNIPHHVNPTPTPVHPQTSNGGKGSKGATTSATSTRNPGIVTAMSSLGNLCTNGGAARLWVVLLVLFALFCFILSAQKFEINSSVRDWNIGLILAVFVGLLIFWYISAACRTGAWAPAIATLITIAGLLYTMLKGDDVQEILLLKDGKK